MKNDEIKKYKKLRKDEKYIFELINDVQNEKLKKRIAHELYTYATRANKYKGLFKGCLLVGLFFPVFASALQMCHSDVSGIAAVLLMGCVTAATGLTNGLKYREKWEHFRKYCEEMKREIICCQNEIGKYENQKYPEKVLAEVLEEMIKKETNANSHFLRTAGPHFPDSQGHIKRTTWVISRAEGTPPH